MFVLLGLLVFIPFSDAGGTCSPSVMGQLDPELVYQENMMKRLVSLGEHTVLYNVGNYPMTVGKSCTTSVWHEDSTGKYRIVEATREDGCITNNDPTRVNIEINPHSYGMIETWPDGTKFDVYVLHLEGNVLALYGCEIPLSSEGNTPLKTFTSITKASGKKYGSHDDLQDAVAKLTKMGLKAGNRMGWCVNTLYDL